MIQGNLFEIFMGSCSKGRHYFFLKTQEETGERKKKCWFPRLYENYLLSSFSADSSAVLPATGSLTAENDTAV